VIHHRFEAAVQVQPEFVETWKVPVPPAAGKLEFDGWRLYVQVPPEGGVVAQTLGDMGPAPPAFVALTL
jgi:hypothetical protein